MKVKCSRYRPGVAQRVVRGIALLLHDRGTRREWVVSNTPRPQFTPGKDPVPILQEAGWTPGPVWTGGKSRPHRDSIPDRPARSSVAISTELPGPRLSGQYKGINMNVYQNTRRHIQEYCNIDIRNYLFYNDRLIWFSEVNEGNEVEFIEIICIATYRWGQSQMWKHYKAFRRRNYNLCCDQVSLYAWNINKQSSSGTSSYILS